jgi:hypothetical protein
MHGRTSLWDDKADVRWRAVLTRGLRAVKAEAALSILAFNILHAVNAFSAVAVTPS